MNSWICTVVAFEGDVQEDLAIAAKKKQQQ
jgi:hypothetical protein